MLITRLDLSTVDLALFGPVYFITLTSSTLPDPAWFKWQCPERYAQLLELTPWYARYHTYLLPFPPTFISNGIYGRPIRSPTDGIPTCVFFNPAPIVLRAAMAVGVLNTRLYTASWRPLAEGDDKD